MVRYNENGSVASDMKCVICGRKIESHVAHIFVCPNCGTGYCIGMDHASVTQVFDMGLELAGRSVSELSQEAASTYPPQFQSLVQEWTS